MSGIICKVKNFMGISRVENKEGEEIPPKNMTEALHRLPESFHKYMYEEKPYRRASALTFILIVLGMGTPLWYNTTSTYRAPFIVFPMNKAVSLNIQIHLAVTNASLEPLLNSISQNLSLMLFEGEVKAPLDIRWEVLSQGVRELNSIKHDSAVESDLLAVYLAIVPPEQWPHFSAITVFLGRGRWAFVQHTLDSNKFMERLHNLVWELVRSLPAYKDLVELERNNFLASLKEISEAVYYSDISCEVLIDIPHLNEIVKRDIRERLQPWQITALSPSHQKRLVWDSAPLSMNYIVHVIHAHDNASPTGTDSNHLVNVIDVFARRLQNITRIQLTSEHLWDFEISYFLDTDVQGRSTLSQLGTERLLKEVDSQLQSVGSSHPVLKIVVLEVYVPVIVLDQFGDDSRGMAVASWGAIIPRICVGETSESAKTAARILAALRVLLGVDSELPLSWERAPVPLADWETERMRLRAVIDNAMRTISAVRALKALTEKITNVVINDDVAARANEAVHLVQDGLKNHSAPQLAKIAASRSLADEALSHPSLLSLLYFPTDQTMAVYLPIMLPTLIPLFGSALALCKWAFGWSYA